MNASTRRLAAHAACMFAFVVSTSVLVPAPAALALESRIDAARGEREGANDYNGALRDFLFNPQPRIILGAVAAPGSNPWQAALLVSRIANPGAAHYCGASIYNDRWVVTAAHCLRNLEPLDVHVVAGETKLAHGVHRINARRFIIHSDYSAASKDNDVGLVELFEPLTLSATMTAVAPLTPDEESATVVNGQTLAKISGWGATTEGGKGASELREAEAPFVSREACNDLLSYDGAVSDNMLCAGQAAAAGADACQGDSGGPMTVVLANGERRLAGVVSWGEGCGRPGKYGVYARVSRYKTWIEACVAGQAGCQ